MSNGSTGWQETGRLAHAIDCWCRFVEDELIGNADFERPDSEITARDGLLWRGGEFLQTPEADAVAREHGYMWAEQMVKDLQVTSPDGRQTDRPGGLAAD